MSEDLARFLADRYDEAEAVAKAATPGPWRASGQRDHFVEQSEGDHLVAEMEGCTGHPDMGEHDAAYIAGVDPAHRLADIKLKRAILAEHEAAVATMDRQIAERLPGPTSGDVYLVVDPGVLVEVSVLSLVVSQLGTEFASHPAYKPGWAPEGAAD